MTHSNLPPGGTESQLPGNRPEDIAQEKAWDEIMNDAAEKGLAAHEIRAKWFGKPFIPSQAPKVSKMEPSHETNFDTLRRASNNGDLAVMRAYDCVAQKEVALIVAMSKEGDRFVMVPLGVMMDCNPYHRFAACDLTDAEDHDYHFDNIPCACDESEELHYHCQSCDCILQDIDEYPVKCNSCGEAEETT